MSLVSNNRRTYSWPFERVTIAFLSEMGRKIAFVSGDNPMATGYLSTWRLDTCRHSANSCPAFLVVVTYARLVVASGELDYSRNLATYTGDGRLATPVPHLETLYLTVSRH